MMAGAGWIGFLLGGSIILALAWFKRTSLAPALEAMLGRLLAPEALARVRPARRYGLTAVVAVGFFFAITGLYLLLGQVAVDISSSKWPRNPVPSTAQSRAAGKELYQQACLECHGLEGYGDGARAKEFTADMDLSSHVLAHPSGEMFFWISGGLGDDMPAFEDRLTEEERWHLVNYIRTFGQDSLFGPHFH